MSRINALSGAIVVIGLIAAVRDASGQVSKASTSKKAAPMTAPPATGVGKAQTIPLSAQQMRQIEAESKASALSSTLPFANPPEIIAVDGVLNVPLEVNYALNRIGRADGSGDDQVILRSYNAGLVGPTLRVGRNDTLVIRLTNNLQDEKSTTGHPGNINTPHGFNTTNLHTHGLHVSPEDKSDNIFLEVPPHGRQDYKIVLSNHPSGTHWYHPHKHGSVAIQVSSGMAGALVVDGGIDDVPGIKETRKRERIFVFQQIPYTDGGTLEGKDFLRITNWATLANRSTTINGLMQPTIEIAPKEVQRWRFIHAGIAEKLDLALQNADKTITVPLYEIASDGIACGNG